MRLNAVQPKTARKPGRRLRVWWWRFSLAYLVVLGLIYLAESVVAERYWATVLLAYGPQYPFVLPLPCLLLVSLLLRHGRAVVVNLVALALFGFGMMGVALPHWRATPPPGAKLRVMTLNTGYFHAMSVRDLGSLILRERLDVVCLQEASPLRYGTHSGELLLLLPGWRMLAEGQEVILSRYPITGWKAHTFGDSQRRAIAARIEVEGATFTMVTTHLSTAYPPEKIKHQWRPLAAYLRKATANRDREVEELLAFIVRQPGPVLLAGDFNTPPRGLVYRRIASRLRDSFAAAGEGTGYTFSEVSPHYRIDYLFAGPGITPRSCAPLPVRISDHLPVVGEFVVAKEAE